MGDYQAIANRSNPYSEGVSKFYKEVNRQALQNVKSAQGMIAMGHLHTQQAEVSEMDKTERLIMGGVECISASAFPET